MALSVVWGLGAAGNELRRLAAEALDSWELIGELRLSRFVEERLPSLGMQLLNYPRLRQGAEAVLASVERELG